VAAAQSSCISYAVMHCHQHLLHPPQTQLTHLAQIRAANLSGDCSLGQELSRGNLLESFVGQHKQCVRRRALLSVSLNPYCQGTRAEAAVNAMMKPCLRDTDPFPRTPGL
jgi:mitochondrial inner membrane protease ATP23